MPSKAEALVRLIREVRAAFQDLGTLANRLHADLGVTASMRAVLEHLDTHGPQPVPEVARIKNVSRQHIQTIVDALVQKGLVETEENPAHKRSVLIRMTDAGGELYWTVREREMPLFARIAEAFAKDELDGATATLSRMRELLQTPAEKD